MTAYGCNDPESKQWSHSYINITFKQPVVISNRINGKSSSLLAGPYGARSYQMNFCTKLGVATAYGNETIGWWPPGDFLVYGTDKGCPLGKVD